MRIAGAVVVGVVLLLCGQVASAAEARRERSEVCLETCNYDFDKCQARQGSKANGRCNIDAVRCKNACPFVTVEEPAVPTEKSHERCLDACRLTFKKCSARPENKSGGPCAADDVRCEQACPKPPPPPPEMVQIPPPPGSPPGTPPVVVPAPAATARPKRAGRVEGAAAPAAVSATPAYIPIERPPAPAPSARSESATPPAAVPAEASATGAHPAPQERGFFATLGCFFVSCEPAGSTPCLKQCADTYDECHMRESKRGGECNTRLMNCRQSCSAAPAP
jgi:hypothetical protein